MDIIKEQKQEKKQKYIQKLSTLFTFECDLERQRCLNDKVQLQQNKILTVQKITKGTFFRTISTTYNFIMTHQRLSSKLNAGGVIDDSLLKLSKKELRQSKIVEFEFCQIQACYALSHLVDNGKFSLLVKDPLADNSSLPTDNVKTMKILVHGSTKEGVTKFCSLYESQSREMQRKREEINQMREENLKKRKEKAQEKLQEKEKKLKAMKEKSKWKEESENTEIMMFSQNMPSIRELLKR